MNVSKKFLRSTALVLAAVPLLCALSSCQLMFRRYSETPAASSAVGSSAETRDISTPPSASDTFGIPVSDLDSGFSAAEASAKTLQQYNISGMSVMITVAEEAQNTMFPVEGSVLANSYAKRNQLIADRYGITFFFAAAPMETLKKDLAASIKAGTDATSYYADTLEIPAENAAALANSGLLKNLRQLPFYTAATSGSAGAGYYNSKSYFDASAASVGVQDIRCLYFNTALCGSEIAESLYFSALNDTWTWEQMTERIKETSLPETAYGISADCEFGGFGNLLFAASGNRYTEIKDGCVQLSAALTASEAVDSLFRLFDDVRFYGTAAAAAPVDSSAAPTPTGCDVFFSGKSLFYLGTVGDIPALASMNDRWGVLPLPQMNGKTEIAERNRSVLCVPENNTRLEMTGLVLTAMNACSGSWIGKEYAIHAIQNDLRDNSSYYTLCKAVSGVSFCDFSLLCGSTVKNLQAATRDAVAKAMETKTPVSEAVKSYQSAVNSALKKLK